MLLSDGRLSPFLPLADDDGLDLIVFDKETGASLPIQVKARTTMTLLKNGTIQFDLRAKTYSDRKNGYMLAILFDTKDAQIDNSWLIPLNELPNVARVGKDKFTIVPSTKETSRDRYSSYRCGDLSEVVKRLIAHQA